MANGKAATQTAKRPRILHLHSTFAAGGKEVRAARLMNAFGPHVEHTVVSADGNRQAAALVGRQIAVRYPADFPSLTGFPGLGRLNRLAKAMQGFDLVLTYNWGAMDAVMAHTLFKDALGLPPLVHHEDGFNADEQDGLKTTRNWYRRIALGKAAGLVVPSETLEEIALTTWQQPMGRVKHIPNGIDTKAYAGKTRKDAIPGLIKRPGEHWVGTLAGLRPVKRLPALVRAFAALPWHWHLVIAGEGPEREAIRAEAERLEVSDRVHMPGHVADTTKLVPLFDIFALSSKSEQMPVSLIEAMAAGKPVASPAVGDVAAMVAQENAQFIVPPGDENALWRALETLSQDEALRAAIGKANRERARATFDEKKMIDTYRRLYASAMGRSSLP